MVQVPVHIYFVSYTRTEMGAPAPVDDRRPHEGNCEAWLPERITSIWDLIRLEELLEALDAQERVEEQREGYSHIKILYYAPLREASVDIPPGASFQPDVKVAG